MNKVKQPESRATKSVGLRIWHWANAATVMGLLITVVVRKLAFSGRQNARLLTDVAVGEKSTLDPQLALSMAHSLTNEFWRWHVYLGYGLAVLLLVRIGVSLHQKKLLFSSALQSRSQWHWILIQTLYTSFYFAALYMILSGLGMVFQERLGLSKVLVSDLHEIHEWLQWYFFIFLATHLFGVVRSELTDEQGIVSEMINGGN